MKITEKEAATLMAARGFIQDEKQSWHDEETKMYTKNIGVESIHASVRLSKGLCRLYGIAEPFTFSTQEFNVRGENFENIETPLIYVICELAKLTNHP